MRIDCPCCGLRSVEEFVQLGAADPVRPPPDAGIDAYVEYVYFRENPAGPHRELFLHAGGCRQILVVSRDTLSHEIHGVTLRRQPR